MFRCEESVVQPYEIPAGVPGRPERSVDDARRAFVRLSGRAHTDPAEDQAGCWPQSSQL